MERALILTTAFLVDLEREHGGSAPGRAMTFLDANPDANLYLPFVVLGELAAGVRTADRDRWEGLVAPFYLLPHTPDVSWEYGRVHRHLHGTGHLIGANLLWTAATALAYQMPVVTPDAELFRRVPDLEVEAY